MRGPDSASPPASISIDLADSPKRDAPRAIPPPPPAPGTASAPNHGTRALPRRLGRYELALELASGGFGTVHLARVVGLGDYARFAALKLIHPHLARDEGFVTMFFDEARVAASIHHPNVCSATDFGEVNGILYLAMDFLVGEPLTRVLQQLVRRDEAPRDWEKIAFAARILADAAEGLHAAHESVGTDGGPLGIVHRDVSPPNLFVRYDGGVQVMDFGVAKAAGQMHVTAEGMAKGHVAYFSPEQLTRRSCDRRADVWSLGVVLWEMVTGQRLFARDSIESTLFAIARDDAPPPSAVVSGVPPLVDVVVGRALRKDPDERYQTAREMGDALLYLGYESKVPMGAARVSEIMERLFPGGLEEKQVLIERARALLGPARRDETPLRTIKRISSRPPPAGGSSAAFPPPAALPRALPPPPPAPRPSAPAPSSRWRAAGIATVAAVAGLALGVVAVTEDGLSTVEENEAPTTPAAPVTAPERPPAPDLAAATAAAGPVPRDELALPDAGTTAADPAEPVPAAGPQTTGFVNVVTRGGWADVRYAGRSYGPTPVRIRLPTGRRRLTLLPGGRGPRRHVEIDVDATEVVRVVVPLD
jgi:serine/threonine-protein kinase